MTRVERLAPWAAGLVLSLPILAFRYPPMSDLPQHEAIVAVLRHFHDRSLYPAGLYLLNLGQANQLFYYLAWLFALALPTDWACKLLVATTLLLLPPAVARLASHSGAPRWVALIAAPIGLGWLFTWGLLNDLMGVVALMALLPTLDALATTPTPRRALEALAGFVLLYETHLLMLVAYAGASVVLASVHRGGARQTALRIAPFFAGLAITVAALAWSERYSSPGALAIPNAMAPLWVKITLIPDVLVGDHDAPTQWALVSLTLAFAAAFAALGARYRSTPAPRRAWLEVARERRLALVGIAFLGLYLLAPASWHGATLVYQRFFAPAFLVLVVDLASGNRGSVPRPLAILASALPVATVLAVVPDFATMGVTMRALDALVPRIAPGSAIAQVNVTTRDESNPPMLTSSAHILAARGGRMLYSFTESAVSPAFLNQAYEWYEPMRRMGHDNLAFVPSYDLTRFRYVLVHASNDELGTAVTAALAPQARLLGGEGQWLLFESTLRVVSPTSPDGPGPPPGAESLRARFEAMAQRQPPVR